MQAAAGPPGFRLSERACRRVFATQRERKTFAVDQVVPAAAELEIEQHAAGAALDEREVFAAVAQVAGSKLAGDAAHVDAGVSQLERHLILNDDGVLTGRQAGDVAAGEVEGDAVGELHAGQIDRVGSVVFQLDEFKIVVIEPRANRHARIVVDLRDLQGVDRQTGRFAGG